MNYNKIYNLIRLYEGDIITFVKDTNIINDEFIRLLSEDLKSEYKIEVNEMIDYHNITEKTVVFMNFDRSINFKNMVGNKNVILFVLRNYYQTSNTQLFGNIENVDYIASFILFMKNEKMKILKMRNDFDNSLEEFNADFEEIINIKKLNRNIKLKILSKK